MGILKFSEENRKTNFAVDVVPIPGKADTDFINEKLIPGKDASFRVWMRPHCLSIHFFLLPNQTTK